ncbi:hypothetical protein DESC_40041 [Desulfosarcina cetonica]|nr:hypothetical protein DESC_40041 [Desulfosarcina cetonica]
MQTNDTKTGCKRKDQDRQGVDAHGFCRRREWFHVHLRADGERQGCDLFHAYRFIPETGQSRAGGLPGTQSRSDSSHLQQPGLGYQMPQGAGHRRADTAFGRVAEGNRAAVDRKEKKPGVLAGAGAAFRWPRECAAHGRGHHREGTRQPHEPGVDQQASHDFYRRGKNGANQQKTTDLQGDSHETDVLLSYRASQQRCDPGNRCPGEANADVRPLIDLMHCFCSGE